MQRSIQELRQMVANNIERADGRLLSDVEGFYKSVVLPPFEEDLLYRLTGRRQMDYPAFVADLKSPEFAIQREVYDIAWSSAHSGLTEGRGSQPLCYLGHSITFNQREINEPFYYERLESSLNAIGIRTFRPVKYFNDVHHPCAQAPELLMFADLLIISLCAILVLDLTEGLSFGGTVEATFAKTLGIPIIVVSEQDQRVSAWARGLADYHLEVPRKSPTKTGRVDLITNWLKQLI